MLAHFIEEYISIDNNPAVCVKLFQDWIWDHVRVSEQIGKPIAISFVQVKIHVLIDLRSLLNQMSSGCQIDCRGGISAGDRSLWESIGGVLAGVWVIFPSNCLPIFSCDTQFCESENVPTGGIQDVCLSNVGYNIIRLEQQVVEVVCGYWRGFLKLRRPGFQSGEVHSRGRDRR